MKVFLSLGCAFTFGSFGLAAEYKTSAPQPFGHPYLDNTAEVQNVAIAGDRKGNMMSLSDTDGSIWVTFSQNDGRNWTAAQPLPTEAGTSFADSQIAFVNGSRWAATWTDSITLAPYAAATADNGVTWSQPFQYVPPIETRHHKLAASALGNVIAVFNVSEDSQVQIYYSVSSDFGETYTEPAPLPEAVFPAPHSTGPSQVVWTGNNNFLVAMDGPKLLSTTDAGLTWSPVAVPFSGRIESLGWDGKNAVFASVRLENPGFPDSSLAISRSHDGGVTWSATETISSELFGQASVIVNFGRKKWAIFSELKNGLPLPLRSLATVNAYVSHTNGETWTPLLGEMFGADFHSPLSLVAAPARKAVVAAWAQETAATTGKVPTFSILSKRKLSDVTATWTNEPTIGSDGSEQVTTAVLQLQNLGPSARNIRLEVYVSEDGALLQDTLVAAFDIKKLGKAAHHLQINVPAMQPGQRLIALADSNFVVPEIDEKNNVAVSAPVSD